MRLPNTLADIMTRLRASDDSHLVTARIRAHDESDLPGKIDKARPTKRKSQADTLNPLPRRLPLPLPTELRAIPSGRQDEANTVFQPTSFARHLKVRKPLPFNGVRYPLVGGTR